MTWYPQEKPNPAGSVNASARDLTKWLRFQLAEGRYNGKRLVSAVCYYREQITDNAYSHPIEGVVAIVDLIGRRQGLTERGQASQYHCDHPENGSRLHRRPPLTVIVHVAPGRRRSRSPAQR